MRSASGGPPHRHVLQLRGSLVSHSLGTALQLFTGKGGTTQRSGCGTPLEVLRQMRPKPHAPVPQGEGPMQSTPRHSGGVASTHTPPVHASAGAGSQQFTPHCCPSVVHGRPSEAAGSAGHHGSEAHRSVQLVGGPVSGSGAASTTAIGPASIAGTRPDRS